MKRFLKSRLILTLAAVLMLAAAIAIPLSGSITRSHAASSWNTGDVFVGVNNGTYQVYTNAGVLKDSITTGSGYTTGCALDTAGNLYGTYFSTNVVNKFDATTHVPSSFGSGYSTPESVAFDAAGHVFVGNLGAGILEFDSAGNFIKTVTTDRVDWFDIAADQDTILYTQEGTDIKRVSISSGPLSNFTTGTATQAFALRILSDGGVLLADGANVKRYDSAGNVVGTYGVTGENTWFSLNLDPDGTSFWAGDFGTGKFYKFAIGAPGNYLDTQLLTVDTGVGGGNLYGICLKGEITAATPEITLDPATATNDAVKGNTHTVTATVKQNGQPVVGTKVTFSVVSGPNTGATGTCSVNVSCATDANGQVSFTYASNGTVGTDTIQACFTDKSGTQHCATATKDWVASQLLPAKTGALTMGFWQNKNGQGIISGGASTSGVCNSGTWLRHYAPFQDLSATASCSAVATYVYNVIKAANASGSSMNAMLKAQMLATALDVYFSDSSLGSNKINAPAPIGGVKIDLTKICTDIPTCTTFVDVSSAFGANSLTVSQMLTYAASQSNVGGTMWYGNVKATQQLAKDAFDAINNQVAFAL